MAQDDSRQTAARVPGAFIIDPKSTLTPAFCGAATWMIAKSLVGILDVDDSFVGIAALVVSGLFAAAVVAQLTVRSLWLRGLYWVLNALIILTMGVGGSTLASIGDKPDSVPAPPAASDPPTRGPSARPSPLPTPAPTPTAAADAATSGTVNRPEPRGQDPARRGESADQAAVASGATRPLLTSP